MSEQIAAGSRGKVVVVGAGIIGLACAHYLRELNYQLMVIDQGTIGGACSHSNCGYVCPSHVLPLTEPHALKVAVKSLFNSRAPFRVRPWTAIRHLNWFLQFALRCRNSQMLTAGAALKAILDSSMHEYRNLVAGHRLECEWKENGLLYVLKTSKGLDDFAASDAFLREHFQVGAERIDGRELQDFEPALKSSLAGAFYYAGDASVRPDKLNSSWSSRLKHLGVTFRENCRFSALEKDNQRATALLTNAGRIEFDHVVFATGAWSSRLANAIGCRLPVQPGKGYSVTMTRPEKCPRFPMLFPEHKVGVSPFDDGYRLGSMMEFAGFDESIDPRRILQLRESAEPYLQTPHTNVELEQWFGWRPMTWDSLPVIGRVPGLSNAYLATGHNMLGVSLAPATGKLIAEIMSSKPTHIPVEPYSPGRF